MSRPRRYKVPAGELKKGQQVSIEQGSWFVRGITTTRSSVILELESYFNIWNGNTRVRRVMRKVELVEVVEETI